MLTELVSRIQFAFTMTAHIQYPAVSIGLVTFLVITEGYYLATGSRAYYNISRFFSKIFALTFGMGVVSGIVMEYQLGTNWGGFSQRVGPLLGVLFTYEVMTAFFVESGFLGVMLFGWDKVSKKAHYVSTCLVCFGTHLSAFWIMSANSWMQTPTGHYITKDGFFATNNYFDVIFNPSTLTRFTHMILSCYISACFVVMGISAYYIFKNKFKFMAQQSFKIALIAAVILTPTQLVMGDLVGLKVFEYQPIKTAAMAANWDRRPGVPLLLFAIPNYEKQQNDFEIGIPKLESFINTHDFNGVMPGLKDVIPEEQPNVWWVFYTFRIMVACGMVMLTMSYVGLYFLRKKTLFKKRWFMACSMLCAPLGLIAMETGWFTAEIGRQPWIVYGLMKTSEAASQVNVKQVQLSLGMIVIVYSVIFGYFYFRYLGRIITKGPKHLELHENELAFHYLETFHDDKEKMEKK